MPSNKCAPKMSSSCFKVTAFVIIIAAILCSRLRNLSSSYENCSVKMEKSGDGEIVIKTNAFVPFLPASCSDDLITKLDGFGDHKLSVARDPLLYMDPLSYLIETRTEHSPIKALEPLFATLGDGRTAQKVSSAFDGWSCTTTTNNLPWGSKGFRMTCHR